jgi:hypothetical protein
MIAKEAAVGFVRHQLGKCTRFQSRADLLDFGGSAVAKQRLTPGAVFVPAVSRSSAPAPTAVSKVESLREAKNSAGKNALRLIQIF